MSIILEKVHQDEIVEYFARHCPKCGGELDGTGACLDCHYSDETMLTAEEAREFTTAGD